MKRITSYILILLIAFQVISAVPAGWALISDPSGETLGLPIILLNQAPFDNFLIPGLFLFFILGLIPLLILYGLITKKELKFFQKINIYKNHHWSWTFSYYFGLVLIVWINMQLYFRIGFDILHLIYSMLGICIVFTSHLPATKAYYRTNKD
ncbi:hypothetical protein GCM10023314_12550 [Algibacter agarivorans]|uniref:Uncharacterized protein n=1 Tax=Algibacter agarivorans TaxID=1109741 RepID=A0ABP9GM34_9FLAO